MSAAKNETSRQQQADRVARLLKEYSAKLDSIQSRVYALASGGGGGRPRPWSIQVAEASKLFDLFVALSPSLEAVLRFASQMLEHFALDKLAEVEIKLRLEELEQLIDATQNAFDKLRDISPDLFRESRLKPS